MPRPTQPKPYRDMGVAIRDARKAAHLTQEQLAERAHISQAHVTKLENGYGRTSPETLDVIARVLNTDAEALRILAGFQKPPRGDVTISVSADKAAQVRWFAELPAGLQQTLRLLKDRLGDLIEGHVLGPSIEGVPDHEPDGDTSTHANTDTDDERSG